MREIKGTLNEYRWTSSPNPSYPHRLTTFKVDNTLHRKLKAHPGMVNTFDELSGESSFYVHGKEIIGVKNGDRMYKQERIPPSKGKLFLLLGIFLIVWPFLAYGLSATPSFQSADGFGLKFFSLLVGFVSVPGGLFFLSVGSAFHGRSKRLIQLETIAEKENLDVSEV